MPPISLFAPITTLRSYLPHSVVNTSGAVNDEISPSVVFRWVNLPGMGRVQKQRD